MNKFIPRQTEALETWFNLISARIVVSHDKVQQDGPPGDNMDPLDFDFQNTLKYL